MNTLKKRSMNSWPAVCPGKMPPPPPAASLATLIEEDSRAVWGWTAIERFFADIRYGLRTMRRNPGFTALTSLSLALGIGAHDHLQSD